MSDFKSKLTYFSRCNLSSVVLQMLAMGIKDVVNFDFMDQPSPQVRRDLFYLLDYVTPAEIFQIGDRKKKKKAWWHLAYHYVL